MKNSASSTGTKASRTLSSKATRIFKHWQQTFSSLSQTASTTRNTLSPFALHSPSEPSLQNTLPPSTSNNSNTSLNNAIPVASPNERQHTSCINLVNKLFEKSPIIIFLHTELQKVGCSPPVYCAPCPVAVHGGFNQEMGIVLCENNNHTARRVESTLAHEMVHAFDHCRFKFDKDRSEERRVGKEC